MRERENNPMRQACQAAAEKNGETMVLKASQNNVPVAAEKNGEATVLKASQNNVPAAAEPHAGHRRYLHKSPA